MSSSAEATRWILTRADELLGELARFRTERTGDPVSPSLVGALYRTARAADDLAVFEAYLRLYPSSSPARRTQSTLPQARYLCEKALLVLADVRKQTSAGAWARDQERAIMAQILGITLRTLKTQRAGPG